MKPEEFCYWLQGTFEMTDVKELNAKQTATLKRHLNMVFEHIAHLKEEEQPAPTPFRPHELERC